MNLWKYALLLSDKVIAIYMFRNPLYSKSTVYVIINLRWHHNFIDWSIPWDIAYNAYMGYVLNTCKTYLDCIFHILVCTTTIRRYSSICAPLTTICAMQYPLPSYYIHILHIYSQPIYFMPYNHVFPGICARHSPKPICVQSRLYTTTRVISVSRVYIASNCTTCSVINVFAVREVCLEELEL